MRAISAIAITAALMSVPPISADGNDEDAVPGTRHRVLSVDYCADQYVMALAEQKDVLALSLEADSEYSYQAVRAKNYKRVRPTIEEILMEDPALIVRQWGGGYGSRRFIEQMNIQVAQVSFDERLVAARDNLEQIGSALGREEQAAQLVTEMNMRLERLKASTASLKERKKVIYITPGGATSGSGTFTNALLEAAGVENVMANLGHEGWLEIDLETLVEHQPDMFVGAFFDLTSNQLSGWSIARHHLLRNMIEETPSVMVPGKTIACSAWFALDAIEMINHAAYGSPALEKAR